MFELSLSGLGLELMGPKDLRLQGFRIWHGLNFVGRFFFDSKTKPEPYWDPAATSRCDYDYGLRVCWLSFVRLVRCAYCTLCRPCSPRSKSPEDQSIKAWSSRFAAVTLGAAAPIWRLLHAGS